MYELATGTVAFSGSTAWKIGNAILTSSVTPAVVRILGCRQGCNASSTKLSQATDRSAIRAPSS